MSEHSRTSARRILAVVGISIVIHVLAFFLVAPMYRPAAPIDSEPVVVEVLAAQDTSLSSDEAEAERAGDRNEPNQ